MAQPISSPEADGPRPDQAPCGSGRHRGQRAYDDRLDAGAQPATGRGRHRRAVAEKTDHKPTDLLR